MVEEYKVIPIGGAKDLRGQKFGRLTVLDRVEKPEGTKGRNSFWLCNCDCGEKKAVRGNLLASQHTQSCGCLNPESVSEAQTRDLTGRVFGQLKVIRVADGRGTNGHRIWECECACGKTSFVTSKNLVQGYTRSCGHLDSDGEEFGTKRSSLDKKLSRNNTSGHKGVHWCSSSRKWVAQIKFQSKQMMLGRFDDIQDAIDARKEAEELYFKPVIEYFEDRR